MSKRSIRSLDELDSVLPEKERKELRERQEKEEYQDKWRANKYKFRQMIATKNRKWLKENASNDDFEYTEEYPNVYQNIKGMFEDDKKRNFMIHLIVQFLPLNVVKQVPKLPPNKTKCPLSQHRLTDTNSLVKGDRDKHLAYTGKKTDVIISGIALQELERFVMYCTKDFDTREGHIVNYALDEVRTNTRKNGK